MSENKHEEIERRFLVYEANLIAAGIILMNKDFGDIVQGYLPANGDYVERLRKTIHTMRTNARKKIPMVTRYEWTIKGPGHPKHIERETHLSKDQFMTMWPLFEPIQLHKRRYTLKIQSLHAPIDDNVYLDVFLDGAFNHMIAEVEFDTEETAAAYEPEYWFGREITGERELSNYSLAVKLSTKINKP